MTFPQDQFRMDSSGPAAQEVSRLDYGGTLGEVERTPQGGLRVPAGLTRTGVLVYPGPNGTEIREYRPPEEVFHPDSLATLPDAPVTDLHPPVMVDPGNFRTYSAGHVVHGTVRQDGSQVAAFLVIQEGQLLAAVERKDRREVSCGYRCLVDETPGVTPEGERYDRVQRRIRYNHVAIVPHGRAGESVSLRMDAAGNVIPPGGHVAPGQNGPKAREEKAMFSIRIDGVDYPLGTEAERQAAVQAFQRFAARADSLQNQVATLTAARDQLQGRLDSAEGQLRDLQARLDAAENPARLDAQVRERAELLQVARAVLGQEVKLDGLSAADIRLQVLRKARPEVKLDGRSEDYILGLFQGVAAARQDQAAQDPDGLGDLRRAATPRTRPRRDEDGPMDPEDPEEEGKVDAESARQRNDKRNRTAWREPLAYSKDRSN